MRANRGGGLMAARYLLLIAFFSISLLVQVSPGLCATEEGMSGKRMFTEQETATEKFFSHLEATLAKKFFDYRLSPKIRLAIFDFTDGDGNVVKAGRELADKLTRHIYPQSQFDVISEEKIKEILSWIGVNTLSRLEAKELQRLQSRINTLAPQNNIQVLVTGEIRKGTGRSIQVTAFITNFRFHIGEVELEKNIVDMTEVAAEIPLPTEQALQESTSVVLRAERHPQNEGRLVVLANTRGHILFETRYVQELGKDQPFPWEKVPSFVVPGKEEVTMPDQIKIALGKFPLFPIVVRQDSPKRFEYAFLHGKCATNEIFFDANMPAQAYYLNSSFVDLKTSQFYSESSEIQVSPGATTLAIVSFYVPSDKERMRSQQRPGIMVYQLFGKGLKISPK
jgi:hypothetical protein